MEAVWVGIAVTIITFLGGALGLYLQKQLPDEHSVEKSRDMIGAVMGLVTLLLALVLGTIVGSAYFFSATQQSELQALSAQAIQLDEALAQFGPRRSRCAMRGKKIWTRTSSSSGAAVRWTLGSSMSRRRWPA